MTISVRTCNQDGTDSRWLDRIGQVQNWKHTTTFPGGAASASFDFAAPFLLQSPALAPGRLLYAYSGTSLVWSGRLEQPRRGAPWACTCTGLAALAKDYAARASNIYTLNTTIDNAIANGLPWTRTAALTSPSGAAGIYTDTVDGALGALVTQGGYWNLTPSGSISTPTGPRPGALWLLFAADVPGGRTFDNYFNTITGLYLNSGAGGALTTLGMLGDAGDIARWGRHDYRLDLTGLGAMSTASATAAGTAILARYAQGPAWSEALTATDGQLFSMSGVQPDLATIDPGVIVRVMALNPDTFGTGQAVADIPIGQIDYDDTSGSIQLTPLISSRDDMQSLLAKSGQPQ